MKTKLASSLAAVKLKTALRISHLKRALAPMPALLFEQVFFYGGLAAIAWGAGLIYKPAGFIVGGVIGLWLATLISAERRAKNDS